MMSLLSVPVSFKEVYTVNIRNLHINPNWTIAQFIQNISSDLCREFNIQEDNLEIVEGGQYTAGIRPEAAPALTQDTTIKMEDKWGRKLNVAFYVRRKDYLYPELNLNLIRQPSTTPIASPVIDECPVCYETIAVTSRHTCSHTICDRCYQSCCSSNYIICPLCRQP